MGKITVAGVGIYEDQLTLRAAKLLKGGKTVILHTARCGLAEWLSEQDIPYTALDHLYESCDDFDDHACAAAECVARAAEDGDVIYCVFDVRDESALILAESGAEILPGPPLEGALMGHASGEVTLVSASDWADIAPDASRSVIVREIDSRELASEVKLRLMDAYPDDAQVLVLTGGGIARISLYALDRLAHYDHTTSALVRPVQDMSRRNQFTLTDLQALVRRDAASYKEEDFDVLCDLLTRLAGAAAYAEDRGEYRLADVITDSCAKLLGC